jgi:hypothetical protein
MTTRLTSQKVNTIFDDCLFKEGEDSQTYIQAEGIVQTVRFHPERLKSHRAQIEALLLELPEGFQRSTGGGMSFLNACLDRHGDQWTDFQQEMEQLFLLGIAIGKAKCQTSRDLWKYMPGGVPYYVVE